MEHYPKSRKEAKEVGAKKYMTGLACPHGHISPRNTDNGACNMCQSIARSKKYAAGWRQPHNPETAKRKYAKYVAKNPKMTWVRQSVSRAKKRASQTNVPFDLTVEYIKSIFPDVCPIFGTEFVFIGNKVTRPESPSIDKIVAEKGYVMGNVAIISMKANIIKQNATSSEIRKVADWLESKGY